MGFLLLFFAAAMSWAQPCQTVVVPANLWPQGDALPPEGKLPFFTDVSFSYAGGKYFARFRYRENGEDRVLTLVGDQLGRFRRIVPRDFANLWGIAPVYGYFRGLFLGQVLDTGSLAFSHDGLDWYGLAVPSGLQVHWDGHRFVSQHFLRGIWTSPDGINWNYEGSLPGASFYSNGVPDGQRYVTCVNTYRGFQCFPGFTEDFRNWTWKEPPRVPGWFIVPYAVGNGYYWADGPMEEQLSRSRDGLTWEELPFPSHPLETKPRQLSNDYLLVGRHLMGWALLGESSASDGKLHVMVLKTDGPTWSVRDVWQTASRSGEDARGSYYVNFVHPFNASNQYAVWDGKNLWVLFYYYRSTLGSHWTWLDEIRFLGLGCADLGDPMVFAGVGRGAGAPPSFWKTSLSLSYPGQQQAEVLVQWLPFGAANSEPRERRLWLNSGESLEIRDVVGELFGEQGFGSLRLVHVGGGPVVAAVRTYNEGAGATFGQEIPAWSWEEGIGPGEDGWLSGLAESASLASGFRTNVLVQNLWKEEVEIKVSFFNRQGQEIGSLEQRLRPFEGVQWFRPLVQFAPEGIEGVSAVVRIVKGNEGQ